MELTITSLSWCVVSFSQSVIPLFQSIKLTRQLSKKKNFLSCLLFNPCSSFYRTLFINTDDYDSFTEYKMNKGNAKRGASPRLIIWPGDLDLWPWKSIEFQILLRTKYVPSLVKIHWRMLILECSQGCYGRTDGRTVPLLYPFAASLARG